MIVNYIIGIDPGLDGGISILDSNKEIIKSYKMPTIRVSQLNKKGNKTYKRILDIKGIINTLKECLVYSNDVCIESQRIASSDGYRSSLTTVTNYGVVLGILYTLDFNVEEVAPTTWQTILKNVVDPLEPVKLKPSKRKSMLLANVSHDGIADSICIARWYLK